MQNTPQREFALSAENRWCKKRDQQISSTVATPLIFRDALAKHVNEDKIARSLQHKNETNLATFTVTRDDAHDPDTQDVQGSQRRRHSLPAVTRVSATAIATETTFPEAVMDSASASPDQSSLYRSQYDGIQKFCEINLAPPSSEIDLEEVCLNGLDMLDSDDPSCRCFGFLDLVAAAACAQMNEGLSVDKNKEIINTVRVMELCDLGMHTILSNRHRQSAKGDAARYKPCRVDNEQLRWCQAGGSANEACAWTRAFCAGLLDTLLVNEDIATPTPTPQHVALLTKHTAPSASGKASARLATHIVLPEAFPVVSSNAASVDALDLGPLNTLVSNSVQHNARALLADVVAACASPSLVHGNHASQRCTQDLRNQWAKLKQEAAMPITGDLPLYKWAAAACDVCFL